ncbi:MAG: hypothetical protein ACLQIB_10660 [Isosphaeraceae bacterium]
MTGRLALMFCLGLAVSATAADGEPALRFRKDVDRGAATGEEILGVPLDSDIYASTRDGYPDLRIRDDRGAQVPYLLEPAAQRRTIQVRETCTSTVASLHVDEGKALEIVVALGEKAPSASGATIRTPLVDYEHRVRVYGSKDGKDWALLASDGLIYDYTRFMDIRNRDVEFPANDHRLYKLVVEQAIDDRESPLRALIRGREEGKKDRQVEITQTQRRPFRIDGVELWRTVDKEGGRKIEAVRYPLEPVLVEHDPKTKETRVKIFSRREPLTRFSLGTGSRNFSRTARVLVPVQHGVRTDWVEVGRATLSLIQFRAFRHAELRVDFPEQRQENYQLVIENADNPPLEITGIEAEGTPYRLVFLGSQGRTYRVEYGSDTAQPPRYDTAAVLASLSRGYQPVAVTLAPQIANSGYRAERGFRDILGSTVFLTLAIVAMVLALGWALFRAGQRIKKLPQEEA